MSKVLIFVLMTHFHPASMMWLEANSKFWSLKLSFWSLTQVIWPSLMSQDSCPRLNPINYELETFYARQPCHLISINCSGLGSLLRLGQLMLIPVQTFVTWDSFRCNRIVQSFGGNAETGSQGILLDLLAIPQYLTSSIGLFNTFRSCCLYSGIPVQGKAQLLRYKPRVPQSTRLQGAFLSPEEFEGKMFLEFYHWFAGGCQSVCWGGLNHFTSAKTGASANANIYWVFPSDPQHNENLNTVLCDWGSSGSQHLMAGRCVPRRASGK
jgi:hypothetical protein